MDNCELLIVGAGAAGMSAALAAWEAGCKSIVLADRAKTPGGILPQCVHRGFGLSTYGEELTGPEYAERLIEKLKAADIRLAPETDVVSVTEDKTALLSGITGLRRLRFERMILASGCREIPIGALDIAGTRPAGIFTAGQAQELINLRGQSVGENVVIIGSGDLGMIMARRFKLEGKRVVAIIEREAGFGGIARNYHRCIERYSIPLICSACVTEVFGEERVSGVSLRHLKSGAEERLSCDTLVTAVGLTPERSLISALGEPEWLSLCGNCSRVHDIVDSAAEEARTIGAELGRRKDK